MSPDTLGEIEANAERSTRAVLLRFLPPLTTDAEYDQVFDALLLGMLLVTRRVVADTKGELRS